MSITVGNRLMTGEKIKLAFFVQQSRVDQARILKAASVFPGGESGPLIHAYKWVSENT